MKVVDALCGLLSERHRNIKETFFYFKLLSLSSSTPLIPLLSHRLTLHIAKRYTSAENNPTFHTSSPPKTKMHKARRLLSKLRKQSSVQEVSAAHASVQVPSAVVAQTGESGENADEVNVRINHEILQEAIEWAVLLDGSRGASDDGSARNPLDHESLALSKRLGLSFFIGMLQFACRNVAPTAKKIEANILYNSFTTSEFA